MIQDVKIGILLVSLRSPSEEENELLTPCEAPY